jgi:[protein-PII] uridylyltransferase
MSAGMQPCESPLASRSAQVERTVSEAYERRLAPAVAGGVTLLAVGGFGRRELFPHSDVDLLLLTAERAVAEPTRTAIAAFLQSLWDCGLRVSHSVRTVAECTELNESNVELSISLLDERFLAGDRALDAALGPALGRYFHGQRQALARHLCRLARERHAKQGGSLHQLEPNLKEAPGGLRDYQLVGWLARLREQAPPGGLEAARDFLYAARVFLHQRSGRDFNTLTFDLQEEIADHTGVTAAEWMRRYYGCARAIWRAATRDLESVEEQSSGLLAGFREWRSRIANAEFSVSRERVYFRAPPRLEHDPALALRLFEFVGRHGLRLAQETERRVSERARQLRESFAWPGLAGVLAQPHAALALRAMQDTGLLGELFPEWRPAECLVIRDFFHRYTVDEHTLRAIEALEDLRASRDPALRPFVELRSEIDEPAPLNFALLFHDLGKAAPGTAHVAESVRLAEQAMARIGMPEGTRGTVRTIIAQHLELSKVIA